MKFISNNAIGLVELEADEVGRIVAAHVEKNCPQARGHEVIYNAKNFTGGHVRIEQKTKAPTDA